MRTISKRLHDLVNSELLLGFAAENLRTQVRLDCKRVFDEYPSAVPAMTVTPPNGTPYPAVVTRDGDIVVWNVTNSDLAKEGYGELQLAFSVDNVAVRTVIGKTHIERSILPKGSAPDPIDDFCTRASAALAEIPQTIDAAVDEALAEAKASGEFDGPQGPEGPEGPAGKDGADGAPGKDGKDGAPGKDGADGAPGADGKDGKDGKDGSDGAPGADGVTFTPSVSNEGVISWSNDGNRQNPPSVNIKGPAGQTGPAGQDGAPGQDGTDATPDLITVPYEDLTFPVSAGALCYHDGDLYYAKQNISTSEDWTAAHWQKTSVEALISDQKSALGDKIDEPSTEGTSGQVLTTDGNGGRSWTTPSGGGGVSDVQVNGTSVVTDGVANVPVMSSSTPGVATVNSLYGINRVGATTALLISAAEADVSKNYVSPNATMQVKRSYQPVVPAKIKPALFYGLADLAGDQTMASSSNAVGVYTPEAKASIWNMIGLDGSAFVQSEWELIREDTFTNETSANHVVSVDGNGDAFELTDAVLMFEFPRQETEGKIAGYVFFYDGNTEVARSAYAGATQTAGATTTKGFFVIVEDKNGLISIMTKIPGNHTDGSNVVMTYREGFGSGQAIYAVANFKINNIQISAVTGTGHYKLYGRRKRTGLDSPVINVSGTTPSITALPGHRYICGEVSTLTITVPASGCIDVVFTSGSTPTVLTVTSAKTGVSAIKWANGFDPSSLDADTTYEVNILDGEYGVACAWT